MENIPARRCDGCGKPARKNQTLVRCSRCKRAYYHDVKCQRLGYPRHKSVCRTPSAVGSVTAARNAPSSGVEAPPTIGPRRSTSTGNGWCNLPKGVNEEGTASDGTDGNNFGPDTDAAQLSAYERGVWKSEVREGRGRCMIATSFLKVGSRPIGADVSLVPSVLNKQNRQLRCAWCFRLLDEPKQALLPFVHSFCSDKCSNLSREWECESETMAASALLGRDINVPISTVLLLTRILRKIAQEYDPSMSLDKQNGTTMSALSGMVSNSNLVGEDESDIYRSIVAQALLVLKLMDDAGKDALLVGQALGSDFLFSLVCKVMMNSFSISDGEQVAIGTGIFPNGALVNHSCRPNAIQTFHFEKGQCPTLALTVCVPIKCGEEVTVSYTDAAAPSNRRKPTLLGEYKFKCTCLHCLDYAFDDVLVGLRCPECNSVAKSAQQLDSSVRKRSCRKCGYKNFQDQIKRRDNAVKVVELAEKDIQSSNIHSLLSSYKTLKRCCHLKSWYVCWCGEALVNWYIHHMGVGEQEQMDACRRALVILSETHDGQELMTFPGNLRRFIQKCTESKLRLFLNPSDFEAMKQLRDARGALLAYYPVTHELLVGLDKDIALYSFS